MVPTDLLTDQPARQPHRREPDDLFLLTLRQPLHATPPRRRTIINEVLRSSPEITRFADYTQDQLDAIASELNGRPRKTLDFRTPAQALATALP
jgi:hypothetical protein